MTYLTILGHWLLGAIVLSGLYAFFMTMGRRLEGWVDNFVTALVLIAVAALGSLMLYGATFGLTHIGAALLRLL